MSNRLAIVIAVLLGFTVAVPAATMLKVIQRGLALNPESATIAKGDRLVFTNEDDVIHNIHIFGPGDQEKDLGLQKPGATLSYTFSQPGAYMVRCNIHPSMRMSVTARWSVARSMRDAASAGSGFRTCFKRRLLHPGPAPSAHRLLRPKRSGFGCPYSARMPPGQRLSSYR